MKPPTPGLRPLYHDSKQVAKVELHIKPGETLHVSDDIAAQLEAASTHFVAAAPVEATATVDDTEAEAPAEADDDKPKRARSRRTNGE